MFDRKMILIGLLMTIVLIAITASLRFDFTTLFVDREKENMIKLELLKADIRYLDQRNIVIFNSQNAAQIRKHVAELEALGFVIKEGKIASSSNENTFLLRLLLIKDNQEYLCLINSYNTDLVFSGNPCVIITTEQINQGGSL